MNQLVLEKRFQDCSLPIKFLRKHPSNWDKREFFMDIERVGNRRERFRVYTKDDTRFEILDDKPDIKHLLVLVETSKLKEKFLMGHDERHLFIAPLGVSKAVSVADAFKALKPREVTEAIRKGVKVLRQGEWFFIPSKLPEDIKAMHISKKESILRDKGVNPHIAEKIVRKPSQVKRRPIYSRFLGNSEQGEQIGESVEYTYEIYVCGKIRHGQHSTLELQDWHRVFRNLEITTSQNIYYGD